LIKRGVCAILNSVEGTFSDLAEALFSQTGAASKRTLPPSRERIGPSANLSASGGSGGRVSGKSCQGVPIGVCQGHQAGGREGKKRSVGFGPREVRGDFGALGAGLGGGDDE
jgi:hypothetical protein